MDCKIEIKRKVADRSKGGVSAVWIDRDVIADLKDLSAASGWSLKDLAELFIKKGLAHTEIVKDDLD